MTYTDYWRALSGRIHGLMQAGQLHAQYLGVRLSDPLGRHRRLREHCESILDEVDAFCRSFGASIPTTAANSIQSFLKRARPIITDTSGNSDACQERLWASLVLLASFETEISYLLSDVQEILRARCERAFEHLQRSIVVDDDLRRKWHDAFDKGEVACEKIGAVHLLLHGIWAFKVGAAGARTDLVYQEHANHQDEAPRYAEGLVLTEWKKVVDPRHAGHCFGQARSQATEYSHGLLAATELTRYRYVVLVSSERLALPDEEMDGQVVYRPINVAVDPQVPSKRRRR